MPSIENLLKPLPDGTPAYTSKVWRPIHDAIKEARRADDAGPRGDWTHSLKAANYEEVERIATDALANRGKDLQVAAWLTEAWVQRQGINGLTQGLELIRGLLEGFWDLLYPEIEDGDVELRAAPLNWVGAKLVVPVKYVPVTSSGLTYARYEESLRVGYEKDAVADDKRRARESAIEAGMLTAEAFEEAKQATPIEFWERVEAKLREPSAALDALIRTATEKFGESDAPNCSPLREILDAISHTVGMFIRQRRPESEQIPGGGMAADFMGEMPELPASVASVVEPVYAGSAAAAAATAAAPARRSSAGAELASSEDAIARIMEAANYLRAQEPSSAVPYLVLRALRAGELRDSASMEAPSTEVRRRLRDLTRDGQWEEVIEEAERAMAEPCGRAWLDLQRYAATACGELSREAAAKAIRSAVAALVADYPELPASMLADDTPAANAETRAWIDGLLPRESEVGQASGLRGASGPAWRGVVPPQGTALPHAEDAEEDIDPHDIAKEAAQERSGRGRFTRRVQLAQVLLGSGRPRLALPILQGLADEIETRRLEEWEAPETVSHALGLLLKCIEKLELGAEERDRVFARICRVDPVVAMEFER